MKEKEIQSAMDAAKEEPIMLTTTATEMQNNFGKYLNSVIHGQEMIITKNGTPVARIIPQNQAISYLTDSLTGILKEERELYFRRELERMDRESIYEDGALSASVRNIKNLMNTQNIPIETAFAWLNIPETKQRLIKEELKK
jgi:prevent-host-death family protein